MKQWGRTVVSFWLVIGIALASVGAASSPVGATAPSGLAQSVVLGYYDAINNGDYGLAYSYLGAAWHARQSYSNFVDGFANTSYDDVTITNYYNGPDASTVYVGLNAYGYDGTVQSYLITYTLAYEGMYFKIIGAKVTPN